MNKSKVASLIKASISLVNSFDPTLPLQVQCQKYQLFDFMKLTQKQLNLYPTLNKKAIGIRNLFQNPGLRLTVYYLEQGNIMKLHDHNHMQVISKVIKGKMEAKTYKLLDKSQNLYEKRVNIYDPSQVFMIDGNKSFNLHEFRALEPTFFLDIIFPDYTSSNDCTFYIEKFIKSQNEVILEKSDFGELWFEDI